MIYEMSKIDKIFQKILIGLSDKNIDFVDLVTLLMKLGFILRIKGSHHIFTKHGIIEIINMQPKNGLAKPYQVKQIRELIAKYDLKVNADE